MPTETFIKENGKMERLMDRVSSLIPMAPCMKVNGLTINSMDSVLSLGTIIRSNLQEISSEERKQEEVDLNLKEASTKAIL